MGWELLDVGGAALAQCWQRCLDAAPAPTPFQTWPFVRRWLDVFGPELEPRFYFHPGPPLLLPLVAWRGEVRFAGHGLFDYLDLIGAPHPALEVEAAALLTSPPGRAVHVRGVPAASPFRHCWRALAPLARPFATAPWRPAGPAAAVGSVHLRARWRHARLELRPVTEPGARRRALDWLLHHKAEALAARGVANVLGAPEARWLLAMVEAEPATAELWLLRRDETTLSALLAFAMPRVRFAYTIAYDRQAASLSPGLLLLYALVCRSMDERRDFNFLTGEQAFKLRLATGRDQLMCYQRQPTHAEHAY
ncbi:MAG: GNAT family N-acetyltransferase [Terriglobales bacterium]